MAKQAGTAASTSARRRPSAASHTSTTVSRNASSGTCGFHRSTISSGVKAWISTAVSSITASVSAHRPRRHATAARATTMAKLMRAAVHSSVRASPPDRRQSGAANQNSRGPGWAQPLTV
jgi:hypothetical protein